MDLPSKKWIYVGDRLLADQPNGNDGWLTATVREFMRSAFDCVL